MMMMMIQQVLVLLVSSAGINRRTPPLSLRLPVCSLYKAEGAVVPSDRSVVQECRQSSAGSGLAGQCLICAHRPDKMVSRRSGDLCFIFTCQWMRCLTLRTCEFTVS